jgi:hypothetical protein
MDKQRLVDELLACAEDDWLALWMIAGDVEAELDIDDPNETREVTIDLVRELLKRGLRAGDSPDSGDCVHFNAWLEWHQRGGPPGWGDAPRFATPSFILRGCS